MISFERLIEVSTYSKSEEKAGLSYTWVANKKNFEQVVATEKWTELAWSLNEA